MTTFWKTVTAWRSSAKVISRLVPARLAFPAEAAITYHWSAGWLLHDEPVGVGAFAAAIGHGKQVDAAKLAHKQHI
jgi:hypothetical protein